MPTIFRDKIEINGAVFNDITNMPAQALHFGVDILDGWSSTSEIEAVFTPLGGTDGAIPSAFFPARPRQLTIGGFVEAENRSDREWLEDYIKGVVFQRNKELILVRHESIPKFVRVRVSGQREILANPTQTGFRWSVPLTAADPIKYGLTEITGTTGVSGFSTGGFEFPIVFPLVFTFLVVEEGSGITVTNEGTGSSSPIMTLYGPLNKGWYLENLTTGQSIRFDVALSASDTLVIDFRQEIATLNGSIVTATIVGDFWRLVPGSNQIKLFANFEQLAGFSLSAYSSWE